MVLEDIIIDVQILNRCANQESAKKISCIISSNIEAIKRLTRTSKLNVSILDHHVSVSLACKHTITHYAITVTMQSHLKPMQQQ